MNSLYVPYGAYELKASYQRNGVKSAATVFGLILFGLILYSILSAVSPERIKATPPDKIKIYTDIPHPPVITRLPDSYPHPAPPQKPDIGIPVPVPDAPPVGDVVLKGYDDNTSPATPDDGALPGVIIDESLPDEPAVRYRLQPEDFVIVEKEAMLVYEYKPEYPRLQRELGWEGVVYLWVLVGANGDVKEVRINKSSGVAAFDKAASDGAYYNKYSPAIQDGRPVDFWIAYRVIFKLED